MSAVCPACGVAVVPGYVRCPKCHAGLPLGPGRTKRTTAEPGGTALARRRFPWPAVVAAVGVAALAVVVVIGVRGSGAKTEAAAPSPLQPIPAVANPAPRANLAPVSVPPPAAAAPETTVTLEAAVRDLEDTLRRQRLWGRASITGARLDLRSGSCADRTMQPLIDGKKTMLHGAGLTKLRCLEQSGAVVFERDF